MKATLRAIVLGAFGVTALALIGVIQGSDSPLFDFALRVLRVAMQAGLIIAAVVIVWLLFLPFIAPWQWIDRHFK